MQPPIPPGTTLQSRYRLTKILGQGGFGRTYIAEDKARFHEVCVIKEYLIPSKGGEYALQKSKELFQREAEVLYKIDHPQIPKFRAAFEQSKRMFFVQDYVEGKTYRTLLDERQEKGQTFSEGEVVQFLLQMLPVLEHIHSKNIIHRDISPENIILRQQDSLPVLIDFGAVKEGVVQLQTSGDTLQGTTMGKIGYSPDEQLRTGKVFPNSDLYALGVTAVVLMTGKKPQDLLDQTTMTWRWHQWVPTLSTWFANVLNKMLSPRPHNRYQSATEVLQALRSLSGLIAPPVPTGGSSTQIQTSNSARTNLQSSIVNTPSTSRQPRSAVYAPTKASGSKPWNALIIGGAMVFFVLIASVFLLNSIFSYKQQQTSQKLNSTPVPLLTPSGTQQTSTPSPSASDETNTATGGIQPITQSERLTLPPGQTISKEGNLKANQTITYIIPVQQGQQLNASLSRGFCAITVLAPNKEIQAQQLQQWQVTSSVSGEYLVQVSPQPGITQSDYKLDLSLANTGSPGPGTSITTSPSGSPTPPSPGALPTTR